MDTSTLALTPPLVLTGNGYQVSLAKEAEELRDILVQESITAVTRVDSDEEYALSRTHSTQLSRFRTTLRKTREMTTAPLVEKQKDIIRMVDAFLAKLEVEETRLKSLQGEWVVKKSKEQEELQRLAEWARMQAEEAERLAGLAREKESQLTNAPLQEAKARMEAIMQETQEVLLRASASNLEMEASQAKPSGGKMVLDYEMLDICILAHTHPFLVQFTERRREVLETLNRQDEKGLEPSLPGVRVFRRPNIR